MSISRHLSLLVLLVLAFLPSQASAQQAAPPATASVAPDKTGEIDKIPDTFQRGTQAIVRFRRDQAGEVVGFDFNTPALRNIRFTRLNDRAGLR